MRGELIRLWYVIRWTLRRPQALAGLLLIPAVVVLAWLPAALSLGAAACWIPGFGPLEGELGHLLLYQLALVPLTLAVSRLPGIEALLPAVLPYLAVACVLLCPTLADAGRLIPALYPLSRSLPPTWYLLDAAEGWLSLPAVALLLWIAVPALLWALDHVPPIRVFPAKGGRS